MSSLLGPEPTDNDAREIGLHVFEFAELISNGKTVEAVDALTAWVFEDPALSGLRTHYLAITAPTITMGLIREHLSTERQTDELWILERTADANGESVVGDVHANTMCQVLVRMLNDDPSTAHDLLVAHLHAHGERGLFWVGAYGLKCLAGVIRFVRTATTTT